MNIKVEIKKILKGDKPTKAYANIVIDDAVVIHGVGVVENEKGRHMSMPMTSWKTAKGEEVTRPVCHPISSSRSLCTFQFNHYAYSHTENHRAFQLRRLKLNKSKKSITKEHPKKIRVL